MASASSGPPALNHCVLTGELSAEPQEGFSPAGDSVVFLRIEFPLADPVHPRALRAWAGIGVEVVDAPGRARASRFVGGTPVLVAGQVSERWVIEGGRTCRRNLIRRL
jgi:hypothetical protein